MKVRELIAELKLLDPELEVYKQRDDEGNGYSLVRGADDNCYSNNLDSYDIEMYDKDDRDEYLEEWGGEDEEFKQVVVIW